MSNTVIENKIEKGLCANEAYDILIKNGPNILEKNKKNSFIKIFFRQFADIMTVILIIATGISFLLGDVTEAIVIISIVFLNATLGFAQEYRTNKAMEALSALAAPKANVIRDGIRKIIPAADVVCGDIIYVRSGDRIPADALILKDSFCSFDESLLTGESISVFKSNGNIIYMGTCIVSGSCVAEVTETGMKTEMGKIAHMLKSIREELTPLQKKLDSLGKLIAWCCLFICGAVTIFGILKGESPYTMLMTGITLAVAAIPEGMPAIVTVSMAIGVGRIAECNAIVRKLPAVETLGCTTVICTDKTGTLTQNKMQTEMIFTYEGGLKKTRKVAGIFADICCNCVNIEKTEDGISGESTEKAVFAMAECAHTKKYERIYEIPFDSSRKRMETLCEGTDRGRIIFMKGAPDVILDMCSGGIHTENTVIPNTAETKSKILAANEKMANAALRVIGFAYKKTSGNRKEIYDNEKNYIFCGMAGMTDPPRKDVKKAIEKCRKAGIKTVMITGDHRLTAEAIAIETGILDGKGRVYTGADIDAANEIDNSGEAIKKIVGDASVFARVRPEHKLSIVRAYRDKGEIVAMTGDGVNDAPAIKEAHIGISMGKTGSDVTREVSSVSLMDDNFATLVKTVEEGRLIFRNILCFVRYMLSCNLGEVLTMIIAMIMNMPIPLLPMQILLVNIATDGLPAMALGFGPTYPELMNVPPRNPTAEIVGLKLGLKIVLRGIIIGISTAGIFWLCLLRGCFIDQCRGAALSVLVLSQLVFVFACNKSGKKISFGNCFDNPYLIVAVAISLAILGLSLFWQPLANTLMLMPPPADMYLLIFGLAFTGFLL